MLNSMQVQSGSFKVCESDGTDGLNVGDKWVEAVSNDSQLSFPQNKAYGTWTFSFKTHSTASSGMGLINNINEIGHGYVSPTGQGYSIHPGWLAGTQLYLVRHNGPNAINLMETGVGSVLKDTWYDVKITRTLDGEWTLYMKSKTDSRYPIWTLLPASVGSNPIVDNTYTESQFAVWDGDIGDTLKSYTHKQGVEQ